jgi:hypothetical protein
MMIMIVINLFLYVHLSQFSIKFMNDDGGGGAAGWVVAQEGQSRVLRQDAQGQNRGHCQPR